MIGGPALGGFWAIAHDWARSQCSSRTLHSGLRGTALLRYKLSRTERRSPIGGPYAMEVRSSVLREHSSMPLSNGAVTEVTWFVYLLRCGDDSLYTGITNDLTRRVKQHNAGTASRYTRSRLPVMLVYQEQQASRSQALKREFEIKCLSRKTKNSLVQSAEPITQRVKTT